MSVKAGFCATVEHAEITNTSGRNDRKQRGVLSRIEMLVVRYFILIPRVPVEQIGIHLFRYY